MIEIVLLSAITGILIGQFIIAPLVEIYQNYKGKTILGKMFENNDWEG